jgi:hypothetical protein
MKRKCLAIGIIVLLGVNIAPLTSGSLLEKTNVKGKLNPVSLLDSRGLNISVTGTEGWNDWFVSNVILTFTVTEPGVVDLFYKINNGSWTDNFTGFPITINEDGYYTVYAYLVYDNGTQSPIVSVSFKIDKTPPIFLNFSATPENLWRTEWLLNATVYDATSGIAYVEFYVDDVYLGNVSAPGPFVFRFTGKWDKVAEAIPYDNAGNIGMSSGPPDTLKILLFHNFFYNLILRFQMMVQWLCSLIKGD